MTNSPKLEECSKSRNNKRLLLLVFKRGSIAASTILLIGIAGGAWRLWTFIHKELVPFASSNLTSTLNRPVELGGVKDFSLSGVRFGASAIPATSTDPDRATIESVEVGFDPLQLLFHHNLKLDVTLVNPDVYIEQDTQGRWLTTSIKQGKPGAIKTDLEQIRFRDGKLILLSRRIEGPKNTPTPVAIAQIDGTAKLLEKNRLIKFDLEGRPINGGIFSLAGDLRLGGGNIQEAKLKVQGRDLFAADITHIIKLPLVLASGRAKGDLQIHLRQEQLPLIDGTASIQGVTAQIPRMPLPFVNAQGNLGFQGTETRLDNVSGGYGKIPLVAQGTIDQKAGFKLAAVVPMVTVANAQETLKIKSPVPLAGELKADLQLTGAITKPLLLGTVATLKPAQIDKVDFENIRSQFQFSPSASVVTLKNIQGKPKLGGEVTGSGTVKLGQEAQLNFNLAAKNVPGDAIALIYDIKPTFQINTLSATAQLTGSPGNVQTVVQFRAPQATYPATGEVVVAPDSKLSFRNLALSVGGGRVQAYGNLANQRFSFSAQANNVQIEPFVDGKQLENVSLKGTEFNGSLILKGTSSPFKLETIDTKDGGVKIGGGTVAVSNIQLQEQNFSAQLVANGVRLSRILKQYPPVLRAPLAGTFQIAGNRDNFSLKTLQGIGEARLAVGGGIVTAKNIQLANGVYQAKLLVNDANVQELAQIPKQIQGQLTGDFNVAGTVDSFQLPAIQATGQARLAVGKGIVTASNIQLANGIYRTQLQTNNVPLQRLAQIPKQFYGNFNGQFNVAGSVESFKTGNCPSYRSGTVEC